MPLRLTRRDRCGLIAERAARLGILEAAAAWYALATSIDVLSEKDVPKFNDILGAVRSATIRAKRKTNPKSECETKEAT